MSEMSEMAENPENPENPDNLPASATENPMNSNESEALKLMKAMYRSNDTSGDWHMNPDECYIHSRSLPEEIFSFEADNSIEWKYRNVYSMPSPNTHPAYWSPRRAMATSANKSDESTKECKNYLDTVREYLASYQASHGTPRDEYSFAALMRVMGQATGRSLIALFYIIVNITPIAQIFLYILRFVLDKMISIRNTSNCRQAIVKYAILGVQLLCVYVCLVFIFGFIVLPILKMVIAILAKIMLYD